MHVGCAGSVHNLSRLECVSPASSRLCLLQLRTRARVRSCSCPHSSSAVMSLQSCIQTQEAQKLPDRESRPYDGDVCGSPCLIFVSLVPSIIDPPNCAFFRSERLCDPGCSLLLSNLQILLANLDNTIIKLNMIMLINLLAHSGHSWGISEGQGALPSQ